MLRPISPMTSITSSTGMAKVMPASAISTAASAIAEPVALRKTHETAERVADEAERPLHGERGRVSGLRGCAAEHLGRGACGHRGGGAGLGLAPALGAGERGALGDDGADEPRGGQRVDHASVVDAA